MVFHAFVPFYLYNCTKKCSNKMVYISSLHSYISNWLVSSNVKYNHFLSSRLSLSVLELHQIMPIGSWTIPPVRNFTLPRKCYLCLYCSTSSPLRQSLCLKKVILCCFSNKKTWMTFIIIQVCSIWLIRLFLFFFLLNKSKAFNVFFRCWKTYFAIFLNQCNIHCFI